MKLIPGCCLTFLLLSVLIPKEAEGLAPLLAPLILTQLRKLALQEGLDMAKMSFYAKCNTVNDPPEIKCPSDVYGIGMKPEQAMSTAKIYASMFGKKECKLYVAQCTTEKFVQGVVQGVKKLPGLIKKIPGLGK